MNDRPRPPRPTIALTMGDAAGVGPELILKLAAMPRVKSATDLIVIGDRRVFERVSETLGIDMPKALRIRDPLEGKESRPASTDGLGGGEPTHEWARAAILYIEEAVRLASSGEVDAMVTAPINKKTMQGAGFTHPGHTEFIAGLVGGEDYVMMLGGDDLKVVLVTIHVAISQVPALVTEESVLKAITVADSSFKKYFDIASPRIGVAGLNPHAGEGGTFGDEEARVIEPAIAKARALGIDASDPIAPDTIFYRAVKHEEFDCVVCMYHDQGLGPLKLLHFDDGVNTTLGLPIIRTSPDHGTAYDIAWQGIAKPDSMIAAIEMAAHMARCKKG